VNPYEPANAWIDELQRVSRGFEPPFDLAAYAAERTTPGLRALEQLDQIERLSKNLRFNDEIALKTYSGFDQLAEQLNATAALGRNLDIALPKDMDVALGKSLDRALPKEMDVVLGRNLDGLQSCAIEPSSDWRIPLEAPEPIFSQTIFHDAFAELKHMASELIALHKSIREAMPARWSRDWKFWLPVIISIVSLAVAIFKH
jgi:hypothetical protein